MAKAKRVHQIAKSLGVKSKDIIERCQTEGVPNIENHMSTVGAGLEASIVSWFKADGGGGTATATATEPAKSVDADITKAPKAEAPKPEKPRAAKAKKKAAKKKRVAKKVEAKEDSRTRAIRATRAVAKQHGDDDGPPPIPPVTRTAAEDTEAPSTPTEAPVEPYTVPVERGTPTTEPSVVPDEVLAPAASVEETEPIPVSEAPIGASGETVTEPVAGQPAEIADSIDGSVPNVPERPDTVTPAGPQLNEVKEGAKLSGPKVVRIEEPEVVDRPRPAARRSGGGGGTPMPHDPMMMPPAGGGGGGVSRRNSRRRAPVSGRDGRSAQANRGGGGARRQNWREQDLREREQRIRGSHGFVQSIRRDAKKRPAQKAKTAREVGGVVRIEEPFAIKDLSAVTGVRASEIITALFKKGIITNINAGIESEVAMEIMMEYGIELEIGEKKSAEQKVAEQFEERDFVNEQRRPPVITILGHVDHGKTSLLDQIRNANVAAGEAGGITQHTSAFRVNVESEDGDQTLVFLDTPGHEAFTSMRARGAQITDIVVLVVAADDGVMPQTIESINHAKAAGVPIIVALNKIDKPEATEDNIQRIFASLAEHDLSPVQWGGSTELVKISALKGEGITDLLETIDFQAQLHEMKADFGGPARGTVIETKMVEGRGPVAQILIQDGHMNVGDFVVMGRAYGRVRDMTNDRGERLKSAGPATPLEISGLSTIPDAGDRFYIVDSLKMAEQAAEQRVSQEREHSLAAPKITLDNIFSQIKGSDYRELNLIVKADVQGSVETLQKTLQEIGNEELTIRVLHSAVGGISESDVILAEASGAIVVGFHVIASPRAREVAEQKHVEIRTYQIIYELLDDVKKAAEGLLAPELREEVLGHAEVKEVFKITKVGMVAGCYCTDGAIQRSAKIRVTRDDIVIENERVLEQLRRFKDDAKEVRAGQECGMKIEGYDDIKPGDVLECYKTIEVKRTL